MEEIKYELWLERYGLEYARRIAEICESEEEIAARLGIGLVFYRKWKRKHPEFAEAISLGMAESDYAVIRALHKKATGFNVGLKKSYKLKRIDFDPDTGKKYLYFCHDLGAGYNTSEIWGMDYIGETRTVDMHIKTLRQTGCSILLCGRTFTFSSCDLPQKAAH